MKHVFISREGDKEQFLLFYKALKNLNDEDLIDQYNNQAELGIVGVHMQALKLLALRKVFMARFDKSPVIFEGEIVISIAGKVDARFFNA